MAMRPPVLLAAFAIAVPFAYIGVLLVRAYV